jgi:hypothetical protein
VEVDALGVVDLLAADDQLVVLDLDTEVGHGEAGHGQRDPQPVLADLFDVVGRVALGRTLGHSFERPLELVEAEQ